jgi:hypothetical protein
MLLILRGCNGAAAGRQCTSADSSSTFASCQTGGTTHIADAQTAANTAAAAAAAPAAAAAAGVTTPVGAPKPDAWLEVVDKKSGLTYYWNQDSGGQYC